jgi:hypothetical protein
MSFLKAGHLFFSLAVAVFTLLVNATSIFAEFKIADGGRANCVIVRQAEATEEEAKAIDDLAKTLEEVTGAKFSIQKGGSSASAAIIVGRGKIAEAAFPEIDFGQLDAEQVVIKTKGQQLLLAGGNSTGTVNAIYKFLQDFVGCRWWMPWAKTIPRKSSLSVPEINLTEKPAFDMRMVGWFYALNDKEWQARNLLNECNCVGWVHTFYDLVPPEPNYKEYPEWFSLINGKRHANGGQLCLSNKELRNFVAKQVEKRIEENPNARSIAVSQMDWGGACECDNCRLLAQQYGGQSGALIDFLNEVVGVVKVKHPEAKIQTIAYNYTQSPPRGIKADEQIIVQYCPINLNHSAAWNDEGNALFNSQFNEWSSITKNLYVWDYPANLIYYPLPHPNWFLIGRNLRFFQEKGVKGIYEQGAFNSSNGEMGELRSWLYSRLMWNPNQDDNALLDEFLNGYYGEKSAPFIKQYLELMQGNNKDFLMIPFPDAGKAPFLKFDILSQAEELFIKAENASSNDAEKLWRVKRTHQSVQFAFLLRWNELQAEAQALNKPWIFNVPREEFARQWLENASAEGPPGWTKPAMLGETTRLNKTTIDRILNPPPPLAEVSESGAWLKGLFQCPTFLLWLALAPLIALAVFKFALKNEFERLGRVMSFLALFAFIAALGIYSWWVPYWTGKRLAILFAPLGISIFFGILALLTAQYRNGFRKLVTAQTLTIVIFAVGLGYWLKPFFIARYNGFNTALGSVSLNRVNLYTINLQGADLEGANLKNSYLKGSWLGFANLRRADLRNADLRYTTLNHTLMDYSDLRGADLREAGIAGPHFVGAKYNNLTQFPADFDPREYGAVFEE